MTAARTPGTVTLIGSGELAPSMSKAHRGAAARVGGAVRPVFVDTPAGFEPNVGGIAAKAVAYLEKHLGCACDIVSYVAPANAADEQRALGLLQRANYIFTGPGSPTYAVRRWQNSAVFDMIARRLAEGAQLVFASAAAIASGAYALPVYEIFKAGSELHWVPGTDLLRPYGLKLAIMPHWDNAEGAGFDTTCCFMGRARFERLEAMLDATTVVLGIDEHTACVIDLAKRECAVLGKGGVTIRREAVERRHTTGETFPLDTLRSEHGDVRDDLRVQPSPAEERLAQLHRETVAARRAADGVREHRADAAGCLFALSCAIEEAQNAGVDAGAIDEAHDALAALASSFSRELAGETSGDVAPFVELLVLVRSMLRRDGAWALADTIRDRLAELGFALEDTPRETAWHKA